MGLDTKNPPCPQYFLPIFGLLLMCTFPEKTFFTFACVFFACPLLPYQLP